MQIDSRTLVAALVAVLGLAPVACAPAASPPPASTSAPGTGAASAPPAAPAAREAPAPTAVPAPIKVSAAYAARSGTITPLWVAHERGYFAEQGLDVDLVFLPSAASAQALLAQSIQFNLAGGQVFTMNLEHGSPVTRYVAGVTTKLVFKLLSQPAIQIVPDLRGKVVAASARGSVTAFAVERVLEMHGLRPDADVAITYPGTTEGVFAALLAGHVDAAPISTPRDAQAIRQGMRLLVDIEKLNIPYFMAGIMVRTDYAAANPDAVERFLRAHLQGVAAALTDPKPTIDVMAHYLQTDDRELVRETYESFRPTFSRDQLVPEDAVRAVLQELDHPGARAADPWEFYDNSYLERIKASGFVDRLYAGR